MQQNSKWAKSEKNYDNIYEIYQVFLTSDAEEVVIDFQSDSGGIFINVGEERSKTSKAHFPFYPIGKDIFCF